MKEEPKFTIEVQEFYAERNSHRIRGTLHVYLCETGQDIRGIHVDKTGDKWWFFMPMKHGHKQDGKWGVYPTLNFVCPKTQQAFMDELHAKAIPFIKEKIKTETKRKKPHPKKRNKKAQDEKNNKELPKDLEEKIVEPEAN